MSPGLATPVFFILYTFLSIYSVPSNRGHRVKYKMMEEEDNNVDKHGWGAKKAHAFIFSIK